MNLTFIEAPTRLTKTFKQTPEGIEKSSYPNVFEVTSHEEQCPDIHRMLVAVRSHAMRGHCLLKGIPTRQLVNESRAGTTNPIAESDWICLDLDGIDATVHEVLKALDLVHVTHIVQYSASYRITSNDLRAHVFLQLDKPVTAPLLKQWLMASNLNTPLLRNSIRLTKAGYSLSWPIDVTACQNDKLLYIAPPVCIGIKDPMRPVDRIQLIKGKVDKLTIGEIATTEVNAKAKRELILQLRNAAGLPATRNTIKMVNGHELLSNPDAALVTSTKEERGFVYLNLNGGDSWGYYHPVDKPETIYNFKDEPNYRTCELLPDYWEKLTAPKALTDTDLRHLAFLDRRSSTYFRGTYDPTTEYLELFAAKNETQVRHFAKQHGMPLGDFIPEWDVIFDPADSIRVDFVNRVINTFEPSPYMQATAIERDAPPPMTLRVIHHALGNDEPTTRYFINWLAYILQYRDRTLTAWVLHGTTGTGKGTLMHKILTPLFGRQQATMRRMEEFDGIFNPFMEHALIVCVDEMEARALMNAKGVMAKMRNFITEETVQVRAMYRSAYEAHNRTNWLFFSNQPEIVHIPRNDRRYNVGKFQTEKLGMSQAEIDSIAGELQHFHDFLLYFPVDLEAVKTPLNTEARESMIDISESSIDTMVTAVLEGRFEILIDQLPSDNSYQANAFESNKVEAYKNVLRKLMTRSDEKGHCNISRDELRVIFDYTCGNMPTSPNKFTSLLKHHRIAIEAVWVDEKTVRGIRTQWRQPEMFESYMPHFVQAMKPKLQVVK